MVRRGIGLAAFALVVPGAVLVLSGGCDDGLVAQACSHIPTGGCPRSHGVACQDPACEAVYLCRPNNLWELEQRCPANVANAAKDAGDRATALDASTEAGGGSFDASIDAPPGAFGGLGCEPLQVPDCSLGLALSCGAGCCGCEDLFVCESRGWTLRGACVGGVVQSR